MALTLATSDLPRTLISGGSIESAEFGISQEDEAHLTEILRDTVYSDVILAILREYSANAFDANVDAGIGSTPIKVVLPVYNDPTLVIRDFGKGLSTHDVLRVFTKYGRSTKRNDARQVGMLGIGSKSGFAYSDTFTVTSCHDGMRRVFVATLNADNKGVMQLMHEEPCGEETGVEIKIAAKREDIETFHSRARQLFRYFSPRPEINCELPSNGDTTQLVNGTVVRNEHNAGSWHAIMGCVPYPIDLDQLELPDIHKCLRRLSGTLNMAISEVRIAASRERLKYTPETKQALRDKFTVLVDEYVALALNQLANGGLSLFKQRLESLTLHALDIPLPDEWESKTQAWVRIIEDADTAPFYFVRNGSVTNSLVVTSDLRLYVDDTGQEIAGYGLGSDQYIVRRAKRSKLTSTELHATLDTHLAACSMTGVPVAMLSTLTWSEWRIPKKRKSTSNPKHRARMFQFNRREAFGDKASDGWEVVDRVPEDTDVFVILENFVAQGNFQEQYSIDEDFAEKIGVPMPVVYGYKSTEKKPVVYTECTGRHYSDWRKEWLASHLNDATRALVDAMWWSRVFPDPGSEDMKRLTKALGANHPIVVALGKARAGNGNQAMSSFASCVGLKREDSDASKAFDLIMARYPLIKALGLDVLWPHDSYYADTARKKQTRDTRKAWIGYVKIIDATNPYAALADDDDEESAA